MRVEILTNIYKREMKASVTSLVTSASVSIMERAIKEFFKYRNHHRFSPGYLETSCLMDPGRRNEHFKLTD